MGRKNDDYDNRLMEYIRECIIERQIPPTIDEMVVNVEGITSKSSVFNRLQKLVIRGSLTKVTGNKGGRTYYWPTDLYDNAYIITQEQLMIICEALDQLPSGGTIIKVRRMVEEIMYRKTCKSEICG